MSDRKLVMTPPWIDSLRPGPTPVEFRDLQQRGLILRVQPSGLRIWAARFTFAGREARYRLGTYPELSLAAARRQAEKIRGAAQLGSNPQHERARGRMGETVAEVVTAWLRSEDTRHWRERSRAGFEAHLRLRLLPKLGPMRLAEVQRAHVQAVLDHVDRATTRNRTFEVARMFFGWAIARGLLASSPCAGITKLHETPRARVLTDEEIRRTVRAFDGTRLGRYVRVLFLTGVRRDEALAMRDADVDRDRAVWTIPPDADKSGATRGSARKVALSDAVLEVLAQQRRDVMSRGLGRGAYVFPGADGGRLHRNTPKPVIYTLKGMLENGTKPKAKPHKLAKARPALIAEDFRLHDIRRTVADRMLNDLGLSAYVVDVGVLGHAKPKMLGVYAPSVPLKELRAAMETWSAELARILGEARVEGVDQLA